MSSDRKTRIKYPPVINGLRKEAKGYYKLLWTQKMNDPNYKEMDDMLMIMLCIEIDQFLNAVDILSREPFVKQNSRKDDVPNVAVGLKKSAYTNIRGLMKSLGVTPEARLAFAKMMGTSGKKTGKKKSLGFSATVKN